MIICSEKSFDLQINILISIGCVLLFFANIIMFVVDNTLQQSIQHNMEIQLQLQQEHNLNKYSQLVPSIIKDGTFFIVLITPL